MDRLDRLVAAISIGISRAGGFFLLFAALLVSFEVVLRKLFLLPFNAGTEVATYALAIGSSFAFANALLEKAHVRIDVIRQRTPRQVQIILDVTALVAIAGLAGVLAWYAGKTAYTSLSMGARENTPLATPLALPQGLWFAGILWLALVALQRALAAIAALARGDDRAVLEIAGPADAEAEIDEAMSAVSDRLVQAEK